MGSFIIEGGQRLKGELTVQGSKNGALPLLCAAVLVDGKTVLKNCPQITDVKTSCDILTYLGCRVERNGSTVSADCTSIEKYDIPDYLMSGMRSSVVFSGALLGRFGKAELSAPGGCEIGLRPIDLHLDAMRALGAEITESGGRIYISAPHGLTGGEVALSFPSVGATENIMLAACVAKGETLIVNAAREPEIVGLAAFLNSCGAKIRGAGEGTISVCGTDKLRACEHTVEKDRIAATTFMAAAAVTGGDVFLKGVSRTPLVSVIDQFEKSGCKIKAEAQGLRIVAPPRLKSIGFVRTMPYPGFPTDSQADFAVMASVACGTSMITENIFENRFKYIAQLIKMGAHARTEGRVAVIEGVGRLDAACVSAPDLRAGSALVLAGLNASGETVVENISHIDRGYENFEVQLKRLGANIVRGV